MAAVHAGMDEFGVLVFRDQQLDDDQQLVFSRSLGPLEQATGDIAAPKDRRMSMELNDISNLDKNGKILARDDRRGCSASATSSGIRTARSRKCRRSIRCSRRATSRRPAATPSSPTCARPTMRSTRRPSARSQDLVCRHSQIYSRGILGFNDFTEEERVKWAPVRQRLVRRHPVTGRLSLYLASHAGEIEGWPVPEARAFLRDLNEHATQRQFVYAHVWQPGTS